jgi:hypothetical protein
MTKQEDILKKIKEENKKQYLLPEMIPKKDKVVVEYGRFMPVLPEVKMQENASLKVNYSERKTEDFSLPSLPSKVSCEDKGKNVAFFDLFTKNRYFHLSFCTV